MDWVIVGVFITIVGVFIAIIELVLFVKNKRGTASKEIFCKVRETLAINRNDLVNRCMNYYINKKSFSRHIKIFGL